MDEQYEKSGQMSGSIGAVVYLIVGIGVSIMILIFVGVLAGQTYQVAEADIDSLSGETLNETLTLSNTTAASLGHDNVVSGTLIFTNNTHESVLIGIDNFTIDYHAGTVLLAAGNSYPVHGDVINTSYSWGNSTIEEHIKVAIIESFSALETTGSYLPLIVLAFVITLVLALILGMLGNVTGGGGAGGAVL